MSLFRPLSSAHHENVMVDKQLDEIRRVRATLIRIHFELSAENVRDLTNGSRSVGELDDALPDVRQPSTLILEGVQKVIGAGDQEAVVHALESRVGMSLNNGSPQLGVSLRGDHTDSGTIRDRLIQVGWLPFNVNGLKDPSLL
jgi:hypothetical protein